MAGGGRHTAGVVVSGTAGVVVGVKGHQDDALLNTDSNTAIIIKDYYIKLIIKIINNQVINNQN